MPKFVLNRDHVLRTTLGHSISFRKGQPTYVPREVARQAVAIGAECVEGEVKMEDEVVIPVELSQEDRNEKILEALAVLKKRNGPDDFTGNGKPSLKAIEDLVGFKPDRNEVFTLWSEFRAIPA